MLNRDPDIRAVLEGLAASSERKRVAQVRLKHHHRTMDHLETQLELLGDELEMIMPRSDPRYVPVLISAVLRKVLRKQQAEQPDGDSMQDFPL